MHLALRSLSVCAFFAASSLATVRAQVPCNTWEVLPPVPLVYPYAAVGLAYDPLTQELYQAADEGGIGQYVVPWIGRRVGNTWVTMLDPSQFMSGNVRGIAMLDVGNGPMLYAWGTWSHAGPFSTLVHWNGSTLVLDPNPVPHPRTVTVFDDGSGKALYIGNDDGVFRLVGGTWVSIGAILPTFYASEVETLVVHDDGSGPALYAGGRFSHIGGVPAANVARWNGTTWSALGAGALGTSPLSTGVGSLLSVRAEAGPRLYAAGNFLTMDGQPANCVARFDGTSWTGLGTGLPQPSHYVSALASFDDGSGRGAALFALGTRHFGSAPEQFLQRLDAGVWSDAFPAGWTPASEWDSVLLTADLPETPGADLLAPAYGAAYPEVVRFEACGQTGRIFCAGDGSSSACPCGNDSPVTAQAGCLHSGGVGGALRASGRASVSNETLRLEGSAMNDGPVIYYQGTQEAQIPFGDGFICAVGSIVRLRLLFNAAGASVDPEPGAPPLSVQGLVRGPCTRYYSARFRDADLGYCTSGTFNYTNAVAVVWNP